MTDDLINLASVPPELRKLTGKKPPTYRKLYQLAVDGVLPVERHNGRIYLTRECLPDIAKIVAA